MGGSTVIGWRIVFVLLGFTIVATLAYTIAIDDCPFRTEVFSELMVATIIHININIVAIAARISYKKANWITATILIIFLVCLSSITTCVYILWELWQLSSQESFEDIVYHVLIKNLNENNDMEQHKKHSKVKVAKIIFSVLACLIMVNLIYVFSDGSPYRNKFFTS